jgi:ABC-type transporter Mla subunit MlaD
LTFAWSPAADKSLCSGQTPSRTGFFGQEHHCDILSTRIFLRIMADMRQQLSLKSKQLQEVVQELVQMEAQMGESKRQTNAVAAAAEAVMSIAVDAMSAAADFARETSSQVAQGSMQVQVGLRLQ